MIIVLIIKIDCRQRAILPSGRKFKDVGANVTTRATRTQPYRLPDGTWVIPKKAPPKEDASLLLLPGSDRVKKTSNSQKSLKGFFKTMRGGSRGRLEHNRSFPGAGVPQILETRGQFSSGRCKLVREEMDSSVTASLVNGFKFSRAQSAEPTGSGKDYFSSEGDLQSDVGKMRIAKKKKIASRSTSSIGLNNG